MKYYHVEYLLIIVKVYDMFTHAVNSQCMLSFN